MMPPTSSSTALNKYGSFTNRFFRFDLETHMMQFVSFTSRVKDTNIQHVHSQLSRCLCLRSQKKQEQMFTNTSNNFQLLNRFDELQFPSYFKCWLTVKPEPGESTSGQNDLFCCSPASDLNQKAFDTCSTRLLPACLFPVHHTRFAASASRTLSAAQTFSTEIKLRARLASSATLFIWTVKTASLNIELSSV